MERSIDFAIGEYYHVYNRGVDKRLLFKTTSDYIRFQKLLYIRNSDKRLDIDRVALKQLKCIDRGEPIVDIVVYALMPNHFHLLLREKQLGGISTFMNKLCTSHAMYFNKKYERTGPLMCRPFRCKHVAEDDYFRWVISYIHLNPKEVVQASGEAGVGTYPFSSYIDYYRPDREEGLLLAKAALPIDITALEDERAMTEALETSVLGVP